MTQRILLALPAALLAFGACAQTAAPSSTTAQPLAAKDKQVVEAAFTKADGNADGKLSKAEAGKMPAVSAKFDDLDKDKDGQLSLDEFSSAVTTN